MTLLKYRTASFQAWACQNISKKICDQGRNFRKTSNPFSSRLLLSNPTVPTKEKYTMFMQYLLFKPLQMVASYERRYEKTRAAMLGVTSSFDEQIEKIT